MKPIRETAAGIYRKEGMGGWRKNADHDPAVLEAELLEGGVVVDGHLLQPHSTPAKREEEGSRGERARRSLSGGRERKRREEAARLGQEEERS
jgi:hypothetical protein